MDPFYLTPCLLKSRKIKWYLFSGFLCRIQSFEGKLRNTLIKHYELNSIPPKYTASLCLPVFRTMTLLVSTELGEVLWKHHSPQQDVTGVLRKWGPMKSGGGGVAMMQLSTKNQTVSKSQRMSSEGGRAPYSLEVWPDWYFDFGFLASR